jgi:hypothetical protein
MIYGILPVKPELVSDKKLTPIVTMKVFICECVYFHIFKCIDIYVYIYVNIYSCMYVSTYAHKIFMCPNTYSSVNHHHHLGMQYQCK